MKTARSLWLGVAVAALAGCSTTPVPDSAASAVPSDRLYGPALARPVSGGGSITVRRDSGLLGGGCSVRVWINGQPAADLWPSERVAIPVGAGEHIVSAQGNAICTGALLEVPAHVKPGREARFRIGYGGGSGGAQFILAPTAF